VARGQLNEHASTTLYVSSRKLLKLNLLPHYKENRLLLFKQTINNYSLKSRKILSAMLVQEIRIITTSLNDQEMSPEWFVSKNTSSESKSYQKTS
jgi:hypothetical protein